MKNHLYGTGLIYLSLLIFFSSCANQLPPSGGRDDSDPPKLIYIFPKPNSLMVKGNRIIFKFNEYVDRRSFEESFFISPVSGNSYKFDWSGKEVEVIFDNNFEKDITYVIIIGKDFKDLRGGNRLSTPVSFAFSTGTKLDNNSISGKVIAEKFERVKIMAYFNKDTLSSFPDPSKIPPDYIKQISEDGTYGFTNLPEGKFRLYAVTDEDRNNLYDPDIDKIAMLPDDVKLYGDSISVINLNFIMNLRSTDVRSPEFLKKLKSDSSGFIYSNLNPDKNFISPDHRFYFYFKNNPPDKKDVVENFMITDTSSEKKYEPVFNWINDSLLEVFSVTPLNFNSAISVVIEPFASEKYKFSGSYRVYDKNKFGKIAGEIKQSDANIPVILKLYGISNPDMIYSKVINDSLAFFIDNILEGNYLLFAFQDVNLNGEFDIGNVFPFKAPENYILYDNDFQIKGNEKIENILLEF